MRITMTIFLFLSISSFRNNTKLQLPFENNFIEVGHADYKGDEFGFVNMKMEHGRIKSKYFGANNEDGTTVSDRYNMWALGRDKIAVISAGYKDAYGTPVGLTVDNGRIINQSLEKFDGLAMVYPTGRVVVTNLDDGDLTLQNDPNRRFDIRNNHRDKQDFVDWAESQEVSVFQTHLLVYKNNLEIANNSDPTKRERRFLAECKNVTTNKTCHVIVNFNSDYVSMYNGAKKTKEFFNNFLGLEVNFMINIDRGVQDILFVYNSDGSINKSIIGNVAINSGSPLIAYYFR